MHSIKKSAANEYYLGCAYNEDEEIFFGATDKKLPATIEKAVTGLLRTGIKFFLPIR